jgi:predicted nucleic-acid-binding Zn-ribbon protein
MKKGRCPKCGGKDVRPQTPKLAREALQITAFRTAYLRHYVCVACGYVETYLADDKHLKTIADKWKPE